MGDQLQGVVGRAALPERPGETVGGPDEPDQDEPAGDHGDQASQPCRAGGGPLPVTREVTGSVRASGQGASQKT
jgi:hypothetical protein